MDLGPGFDVSDYQHGVFTRAQARTGGLTDRQVRRRLAAGHWVRVAGIALAPRDLAIGSRQLAAAATLTWPEAVISHRLAGDLWGLPDCAGPTATVTLPGNLVRRGLNLRSRRSELPRADVCTLAGLRLTTPDRTALDLLALLPWGQARDLWAYLVTRRQLDLPRLEAAIRVRKHLGGTRQLRRLLEVAGSGSLSAAEDVFHELAQAAGLTGWAANVAVLVDGRVVAVVDVLFAEAKVAVEIDGWASHGDRAAFQRDRTRQNRLIAAGYAVLRFTWDDLTTQPAYVIATIRRTLAKIS